MIRRDFIKRLLSANRFSVTVRKSSSRIDIKQLEQESAAIEVVDEEAKLREEEIEKKRNKSRLRGADRDILLENNPYPEPILWHHGTLKYLRRAYGRYGQLSGVNPSLCWPVEQELNDAIEYESIKYPYTIPQIVAAAKEKRAQKEKDVRARQEEIVRKMEKLETWKLELHQRIAKKESEARAAKDRKERLIEEVKRHFGYTVDPKDERFKEMLEKKEKEQKKAMKEARRKAKDEKMVEKLLRKKEEKKPVEAEVDRDKVE